MTKIKVAHISAYITGGAGIAAFRVHKGLISEENVDSRIIQKIPVSEELANQNVHQCTHFHPLYFRIINRLGLYPYLTNEGKYLRLINEKEQDYETVSIPYSYFQIENHPCVKEADIVHLHWVGNFLNYPSFFKKIKQPIVWTLHDMNPFKGIFHYEDDEELNKESLGKIDQDILLDKLNAVHSSNKITVVSPSKWLKDKSKASDILGKYPHYLIPYGFNIKKFPILDKENLKKEFKLDNGLKTLFFIAQNILIRRKGIDLLLEALKNIPSKINLITLGNNSLEIDNPNINYIHFESTHNLQSINKIYAAADVTIIPSREDNQPNVMIESFLNGTPIISFPNGGMAEHIQDGVTGLIAQDITSKALQNTITDFLCDKHTFNAERIREYAILNFSEKKQSINYINLYKSILGL